MACLNLSNLCPSLVWPDQNWIIFCCICWNMFVMSQSLFISLWIPTESTSFFAVSFVHHFSAIIHVSLTVSSFWRTDTLVDYVKLKSKATHIFMGLRDREIVHVPWPALGIVLWAVPSMSAFTCSRLHNVANEASTIYIQFRNCTYKVMHVCIYVSCMYISSKIFSNRNFCFSSHQVAMPPYNLMMYLPP